MEFRIHKAEFLKGLRLAQNIADRKSTMPMLANVLLRVSGKSQLELTRGHGLAVDGVFGVRLALDVRRAHALEVFEEHVLGDVTRALEHEVLEQMGEALEMRGVVLGPHAVHQPDGDDGQASVDRRQPRPCGQPA